MSDQVIIEVDDRQVKQALSALADRMADMTPVMREIAGDLVAGVERAFDLEKDPVTGTPWERLSAVTIQRREATGHWPGKKLHVTGHLASSVAPDFGRDYAIAGTNVKYAKTHQFGADKGGFGKTARGSPIPCGNIPPRPFFGFSDATADTVLANVYKYLNRALT